MRFLSPTGRARPVTTVARREDAQGAAAQDAYLEGVYMCDPVTSVSTFGQWDATSPARQGARGVGAPAGTAWNQPRLSCSTTASTR